MRPQAEKTCCPALQHTTLRVLVTSGLNKVKNLHGETAATVRLTLDGDHARNNRPILVSGKWDVSGK